MFNLSSLKLGTIITSFGSFVFFVNNLRKKMLYIDTHFVHFFAYLNATALLAVITYFLFSINSTVPYLLSWHKLSFMVEGILFSRISVPQRLASA